MLMSICSLESTHRYHEDSMPLALAAISGSSILDGGASSVLVAAFDEGRKVDTQQEKASTASLMPALATKLRTNHTPTA